MNLLLDTHILIWSLSDPQRIAKRIRTAIQSETNQVWVSSISLWEIAIKQGLGKIQAPKNLVPAIQSQGMQLLPFTANHALRVVELPLHHQDPFDRALLAQSIEENLRLVSVDKQMLLYASEVDLIY